MAGDLDQADARLRPLLSESSLRGTVEAVPAEWFTPVEDNLTPDEQRQVYTRYLVERLNGSRAWLSEAKEAQQRGPKTLQRRVTHRVV